MSRTLLEWLPKPDSDNYLHLDALRFLSAMAIMVGHSAEFWWPRHAREDAIEWIGGLSLFVDIFFVISGYIISEIYSSRVANLQEYVVFLRRRVARIFPLHLMVFVLQLLLAGVVMLFGFHMSHPPSITVECLVSNAFLLHAVWPCEGYPISGVTWSLSAELVMYAIFPILILVTRANCLLALLLSAASLHISLSFLDATGEWQSHLDMRRAVPAFILGMSLAFGQKWLKFIPFGSVPFWLSLVLFLVSWPFGLRGGSLVLLAYLVVVMGVAADANKAKSKWVRGLAPLGQITYSIYLIHGLAVLVLLNAIGDKFFALGTIPMLAMSLLVYVVVMIASVVSYKYSELPARRILSGR